MKSISLQEFKAQNQEDKRIEIDNVIYEVPDRTSKIQEALMSVRKNKTLSEYDLYFKSIEAILGTANTKKIFNKGVANENIDFMALVVVEVLKIYQLDKNKVEEQRIKEALDTIQPLSNELDKMNQSLKLIGKK